MRSRNYPRPPRSLALRTPAAATLSLAAAVLAGCTAGTEAVERDTSAKAQLDFETGQLILPMSAYEPLDIHPDHQLLRQVQRIYVSECMAEAGFSYTATMPSETIVDDRDFGIWLESYATTYGWGEMPDVVSETRERESAAGGPRWDSAADACISKFETDPTTENLRFTDHEVAGRANELSVEAYNAAAKEPEWTAATDDWKQCLRDAGLTAADGAGMWITEESKHLLETEGSGPSQESIRLASIEARCNMQTNLTQRLGDLVASYQQPLIDQHEAELQPLKERKDAVLAAARDYIAAHG